MRHMAVKPFLKPYSLSIGKGFTFNTINSTGVERVNSRICCPYFALMPSQGRVGTSVLPFRACSALQGMTSANPLLSTPFAKETNPFAWHTCSPFLSFLAKECRSGIPAFQNLCPSLLGSRSKETKKPTACSRSLSTVAGRTGVTLSEGSLSNKKESFSALKAKKGNLGSRGFCKAQYRFLQNPREPRVASHKKQTDLYKANRQPAFPQPAGVGRNPTGWSQTPTPFGQTNPFISKENNPLQSARGWVSCKETGGQQRGWVPEKGFSKPLQPFVRTNPFARTASKGVGLPKGLKVLRVWDKNHVIQDLLPSVKMVQSKKSTVPTRAKVANPFVRNNRERANQRVRLGTQISFNKTQTKSPNSFDKAKTGVIYLYCTSNNTVCTLVDSKGVTKGWTSCGSMGFKSARKSTAYASQATAEKIGLKAKEAGFKWAFLVLKGVGRGKESGVRALRKSGVEILGVLEKTRISHNGCRPPKKRRV